jgi:hypothetical protein
MIQVTCPGAAIDPEVDPEATPLLAALRRELQRYDMRSDPYVLPFQELDDHKSQQMLGNVLIKRRTYCFDQIKLVHTRATFLYEQLGASTTEWFVQTCLTRFVTSQFDDAIMPDLSDKEKQHLGSVLQRVLGHDSSSTVHTPNNIAVSAKLLRLKHVLS